MIPPYEEYSMCPTSRDVMEELFANAPEPPSGWHMGYPQNAIRWLSVYGMTDVLGFWDQETSVAWWTDLPPLPKREKP